MLSLSLENRENAVPQLTDVMCSDTTGRTREPTQEEPLVYAKVRHQLSSFTAMFPSASKDDCQHLYHSSLCVCYMCSYNMYVKPAPMRNTLNITRLNRLRRHQAKKKKKRTRDDEGGEGGNASDDGEADAAAAAVPVKRVRTRSMDAAEGAAAGTGTGAGEEVCCVCG